MYKSSCSKWLFLADADTRNRLEVFLHERHSPNAKLRGFFAWAAAPEGSLRAERKPCSPRMFGLLRVRRVCLNDEEKHQISISGMVRAAAMPEAVRTPPYGFRVPQQNASVRQHRLGLRDRLLSTKKIKGLHENDFIMASKIDRVLDRSGPVPRPLAVIWQILCQSSEAVYATHSNPQSARNSDHGHRVRAGEAGRGAVIDD